MEKRAAFGGICFFTLFFIYISPAAFCDASYDLALDINASENFILGESNSYKVIVTNNETAEDEINITVEREIILDSTSVYQNSGNYSLKKSLTKTYQWTPDAAGEYVLCANITFSTVNDTDFSNNWLCRNVSVANVTRNDTVAPPLNFTCDIGVEVSTEKFFYNSSEALGIKIAVDDFNHSGIKHPFILAYWIEDLFGNVVKSMYENTYEINVSEIRTYNPKAPSISDSEAYLIKAEIVEPGCNDTNYDNNRNETMILVKGVAEEGMAETGDSFVRITKISPEKTAFGGSVDVSLDVFRGDTTKYSLSVWIERPSDGFDVSEKSTVYLKNAKMEYSLKIPVQIKPNCNGRYKDGSYEVIAEGLGAEDTLRISLSGISSELCKVETKTVTKYVEKKETTKAKTSTPAGSKEDADKVTKIPDVEYRIVSSEDAVTVGEPFFSVAEVRNNKQTLLNVSVYSYVISGMSRLSEGLSDEGWKKSWTGNEKSVVINPGSVALINLTNRIQSNVTGNYTFKVKIKGDVDKVIEKGIAINKPIVVVDSLDVSCNATDKKTYLFLKNNDLKDEAVVVVAHGELQSKRDVTVKSGEMKKMTYVGRIDVFVFEKGGKSFECRVEHEGKDESKTDIEVDEEDNRITLQQTAVGAKESFIERILKRIFGMFG
ncbi:MAG: hypothetical protein ABIG84_04480 [archaeon]